MSPDEFKDFSKKLKDQGVQLDSDGGEINQTLGGEAKDALLDAVKKPEAKKEQPSLAQTELKSENEAL
jgi:hypothetical protein